MNLKIAEDSIDELLNTSGLTCPEPLMLLHQAVNQLSSGRRIHFICTDPATPADVLKFCRYLGHQCLRQSQTGNDDQLDSNDALSNSPEQRWECLIQVK